MSSEPRRTLRAELTRPRSLGLLLVAILLAAVFAALGQWQLSRAVQQGTTVKSTDDSVLPLTEVARPQQGQTDASVGQLVKTRGTYVQGDFLVIADRVNDGATGYWVSGHFITANPAGAQLAVGLGWTADRNRALAVAARLNAASQAEVDLVGRYIDSDAVESTDSVPTGSELPTAMAVPELLNLWQHRTDAGVYNGVVTARTGVPSGLTTIYSPKPVSQVELNLVNVVYAAEWALFALIAFYVWYRLVRDRWERLTEPQDGDGQDAVGGAGAERAENRA